MDGFYSPDRLPSEELQQQQQQQSQQPEDQHSSQPALHGLPASVTDPGISPHLQLQLQQSQPVMYRQMMPGQSALSGEDMEEMQRRRSVPQGYGRHPMSSMPPDQGPRRMSHMEANEMMTFGGGEQDFGAYQFNQMMSPPFPNLDLGLGMHNQMEGYMADPTNVSTMPPDIMGNMMSSRFANMDMGQMTTEPGAMDLFPATDGSGSNAVTSAMVEQYGPNRLVLGTSGGDATEALGTTGDQDVDVMDASSRAYAPIDSEVAPPPNAVHADVSHGNFASSMPPPMVGQVSSSHSALPAQQRPTSEIITQPPNTLDTTAPAAASAAGPGPGPGPAPATAPAASSTAQAQTKEKAIYSKSGFDMLKALWLVATRKNPKIHLGAVDMSCAFVVCDVTMNDCPIIYVSDNFQNLTGYSRHEIVGQNCRFLQAPDGKVDAGARREFVDDGAVYNLKMMIHEGREVQQSLINYRKGGKPFLNLLTMIPIPWDTEEIRYFIGFQIDLVECPDAISGQEMGSVKVNYKHSDIGQYIWTPPMSSQWEPENGQTLGVDDVSTLLQQFSPSGSVSDWHKQSWDKMLLENTDDVVHVLSLKGLFLYLSPACKRVLEYDATDLVGNPLSSICHPSDIVPVTRELKDATAGNQVNIVFRIRRKQSGYTWFESHGSLFVEQGKGRKCIILVGRKRPVFALSRRSLEGNGGIGDSELWTKLSTSGMFLFVSSNVRSLLDLQPDSLIGTSIQDLMRKDSRGEFGRTIEKARKGKIATCKHEVQNRRGQGLQAQTILYPGDTNEGQKPTFLLAQTKLLKASSRGIGPGLPGDGHKAAAAPAVRADLYKQTTGLASQSAGAAFPPGTQDAALASEDNIFDELRTTKCSSWQFELRQMEKINRILAEELGSLLSNKKKRKRRMGVGNVIRDCANCHTRNTPEWRRGPSGQRDLCNSCGLRWAKQTGRVSPRNSSRGGHNGHNGNGGNNGNNGDSQSKKSPSPAHSSPLHRDETPNPGGSNDNGEMSSIDPVQLSLGGMTAASGVVSAPGQHALTAMPPPPGQASLGMASIQEERESQARGDESHQFA